MYDKNQVVNWGYNRWSLTNQFAWTSEVLSEKLTMDIDYDFTYYGNNNDFGAASQTLEQDILHHLQLHWAYDVTPALALTTSYQYLWGGETTISDFRPPPNSQRSYTCYLRVSPLALL